MANEGHVRILKQGVHDWNNWRRSNPDVRPDLSDADLRGLAVVHYNKDYYLQEDQSRNEFQQSESEAANTHNLQAEEIIIDDFDMRLGFDLRQANLSDATLQGADLRWADLARATLDGATLDDCLLVNACFRDSNLRGASLTRADMRETDLTRANLAYSSFFEANLSGARLVKTLMTDARMGGTVFADNDLSSVIDLETIHHSGPSTIALDTLYKSGGKIPASFLRGCGVPDDFITFIPSHFGVQQAIQFYSCFISYSSKDEDFARRLYSRMRDEHLRVWFAPEDVKGGEKLHEQIERAIQIHDRLLIVLSEHSMKSEWVMTELRKARRQEIQEKRRKLFPIRLASFEAIREWECFDADTGKDLAVELREYFIPDFSNWKEHDSFEASFNRLLKDLRAVEGS